jgi:NAD(P)-dependent dehydrogenase (short-subunit alcohol dehydrogenase family)
MHVQETDLGSKVAVVTGGASGIGQAIAQRLGANRARIWVLDIELAAAQATADEIVSAGGQATALECNVAEEESVRRVFATIASAGPIDILVNSAGIAHIGTIANTSIQDFERIFRVNVQGIYLCMQAAISTMVAQSHGVIVNLASMAATLAFSNRFAYSMSKGAVRAMTLSVAKDYLDKNIRCNCISPARVHTPFVDGYLKNNYPGREAEMMAELSAAQPIGRMAKPDEVAGLAAYLCSEQASFLTGADVLFDGGVLNLR